MADKQTEEIRAVRISLDALVLRGLLALPEDLKVHRLHLNQDGLNCTVDLIVTGDALAKMFRTVDGSVVLVYPPTARFERVELADGTVRDPTPMDWSDLLENPRPAEPIPAAVPRMPR